MTFRIKNLMFSSPKKNTNYKIFIGINKEDNQEYKIQAFIDSIDINKDITGYFTFTSHVKYGDQYMLNSIIDYDLSESDMEKVLHNLIGKIASNDLLNSESQIPSAYLSIINNQYDLMTLKGIGENGVRKINKKIEDKLDSIILYSLLSEYGVTESMSTKILKSFPSIKESVSIVKTDPYKLQKIKGVNFKSADKIAAMLDKDLPLDVRASAAATAVVKESMSNGSTYISVNNLQKIISEKMNVENVPIDHLRDDEKFYVDEKIIALKNSLDSEKAIAENFSLKLNGDNKFPLNKAQVDQFVTDYQKENNITFTDSQKKFLHLFAENSIVCLLGYAGTGKSAMQKATTELCKMANWSISQAAPTGRAAQVMKEYTNIESSTLHRTFGIGVSEDEEEDENTSNTAVKEYELEITELESDVLLIDEASMIDVFVGRIMSEGIKKVKKVVIVGDPEQLPSVGAGRFLQDLIDGGVPHVELKDVFRQSEGGILDMATKARNGKNIVPSNPNKAIKMGKDAIFHEIDKDNIENAILHYINLLLKKIPLKDITIITPKNVGDVGTEKLNKIIQNKFNPASPTKKELKWEETIFRKEDIVLCNENSVIDETQIYNGELGVVEDVTIMHKIDRKGRTKSYSCLKINFSGTIIYWPEGSLEKLKLGYVITIHKMQGSSNKAIIMIADKSSTYMLNRQLIYTGLTRPQKRLILLGNSQAINNAVRKDGSAKRNTMLATYLKQLVHKKEKLK